jgi:hypothetical protein
MTFDDRGGRAKHSKRRSDRQMPRADALCIRGGAMLTRTSA